MLAVAVLFLDWVLATLVIFRRCTPRLTLRESFLVGATLATAWLVLGTELMSLLHALRFWPVLCWWLGPLPGLALLSMKSRGRGLSLSRRQMTAMDGILLAGIAVLLSWSLCQAWFSPPNNVDSQEYHLQRQIFWAQQGSVEHYATSNLRQVAMPPLTEFAGLTLMILTGSDRYHNLVQWCALVLTLFAVSLTTRHFRGSVTAQLLSALWVVTIPLAFMQASTTKNDVVVMLWTCLLAYWVLLLDTPVRIRWLHLGLIGLAFGALILTKGTGLIFGLPIAGCLAVFLFCHHRRVAVGALGLVAAMALLFNAGHFARNFRTFGSIAPDQAGIHDGPPLGNSDFSPGAIASNLLRNLGPHFVTPSQPLNDRLTQLMRTAHEKLGRSIDDPRTTWMPGGRFRPYRFWQDDEDRAAAPMHLLLVLLLPGIFYWARRQLPWRGVTPLLFVAAAGLVLFSTLLKWQNWHVRLIVALPAIIAPVFGWSFGTWRGRYAAPVAAFLLVLALAPSLNCLQRPLWGPKNIFHADPLVLRCYYHPNWSTEYRELASRIEPLHPKVVGFCTGPSSPDYPMQRLLLDRLSPPPTFAAFNASLQIPGRTESDPDVLLVARSNRTQMQHASTGTWYQLDRRIGRYALFLKRRDSASEHP